jgi:carbonic anhydrase/acetyltransferase-like protein (isoleucine patch superfamily)
MSVRVFNERSLRVRKCCQRCSKGLPSRHSKSTAQKSMKSNGDLTARVRSACSSFSGTSARAGMNFNCYIGPFTSIGDGVQLHACEIEYSIVLDGTRIEQIEPRIEHSLLGKNVVVSGKVRRPRALRLMLGDSSSVELP